MRQLIPRNPRVDKPLVQTCHFFSRADGEVEERVVLYIPHVDREEEMPFYHPTVQRLVGTVALSRRGVDFAALDGEPVNIFFLLISPPNQPGDHLRALENISRHLKDERFVSFLRQAKTREQVIELLDEADQGAH